MKAILAVGVATIFVAFVFAGEPVDCPDENGKDVLLLPNPYNCSTYYMCDYGTAYLMACSPGLEFNAELSTCDWPKHAKCKAIAKDSTA